MITKLVFIMTHFLIFQSFAYTQVEAQSLKKIVETTQQLNEIQKKVTSPDGVQCADESSEANNTEIKCDCEKKDQSASFIRTFDSKEELPAPIKKMPYYKDLGSQDKFTIVLTIVNDNLQAGPVPYVFAIASGRKSGYGVEKKIDGNDIYRTAGFDLQVSKKNSKGITFSTALHSELYSKPVDPGVTLENYFTEDDLLTIFADNKSQNKTYYWSAGLGFRVLNNQKTVGFGASGMQKIFHENVNSDHQMAFVNVSDGDPLKMGPFANLALGINKTLINGGTCSLNTSAELGTHLGTIKGTSTAWADGKVSGVFGIQKSKLELGTGIRSTLHKDGVQITPIMYMDFRRKRWGFRSSVELPDGDLENAVKYNLDKEPIAKFSLFYFIPQKKKK